MSQQQQQHSSRSSYTLPLDYKLRLHYLDDVCKLYVQAYAAYSLYSCCWLLMELKLQQQSKHVYNPTRRTSLTWAGGAAAAAAAAMRDSLFFKSYNIQRSHHHQVVLYDEIWCSAEHGSNKRLISTPRIPPRTRGSLHLTAYLSLITFLPYFLK